jgi:hypothetical protein
MLVATVCLRRVAQFGSVYAAKEIPRQGWPSPELAHYRRQHAAKSGMDQGVIPASGGSRNALLSNALRKAGKTLRTMMLNH